MCSRQDHPPYPPADVPASVATYHRVRLEAARMLRDQGAAIAVGGSLLCSECGQQQPKAGMLDGSGRCAGCAS